jgi:predicted amidohydrolase
MPVSGVFKVACVQLCAEDVITENIAVTGALVRSAAAEGAELICLPEYFSCIAPDDEKLLSLALPEDAHPVLSHFSALAAELNVWLLLGSVAIKISDTKVNNRSYLLNNQGQIVARYNKLHLFDVLLKNGENYRESATVEAGHQAVVAGTPWGKLGMSICYDLRFAYMYRALAQAGASFISIPAAFTQTTGEVHWEVLLRARAIETGCFIFAPDQCGVRSSGRATYGHSLIVAPWGEVLADGGTDTGYVIIEIDPQRATTARSMIPSLQHDRRVDFVNQFE